MSRLHDWPQRLDRYVAGLCDVPFAWGSADCCQFIAGAIHAVTGDDLRALFPAYADETEANVLLDQFGGLERRGIAAVDQPQPAEGGEVRGRVRGSPQRGQGA